MGDWKVHALMLASGTSRLLPVLRQHLPKQFILSLDGRASANETLAKEAS